MVRRPAGDRRGRLLVVPVHPRRDQGRRERRLRLSRPATSRTPPSPRSTAPDPTTLVVTTSRPNTRILGTYRPDPAQARLEGECPRQDRRLANNAPVVGTGPYQVVEWKTGQFVRLVRNPNYWGSKGAEDEIVIQFFKEPEHDGPGPQDRRARLRPQPDPGAVQPAQDRPEPRSPSPASNGWTQLNFNTYDKDIPDGGASTKALLDPAFRDALGYAIDQPDPVDKVLAGYGVAGTTQVPPASASGTSSRPTSATFDIDRGQAEARCGRLPARRDGNRLDKEGKPISLSLQFPTSDAKYPRSPSSSQDWFGQLGIKVDHRSGRLGHARDDEYLPPEHPAQGHSRLRHVIWGWVGDPDPNSLLQILTTDAIGDSSDSQYATRTTTSCTTQQNGRRRAERARR